MAGSVAEPRAVNVAATAVDRRPHHSSVCMVTSTFPCRGKGTGVLVRYKGYPSIVAGSHLIPTAVAARHSYADFSPSGASHSLRVYLRPAALFEVLGKSHNNSSTSLVIVACENGRPKVAPAAVAPAEYDRTVSLFLRTGTLESPPGSPAASGAVPVSSVSRLVLPTSRSLRWEARTRRSTPKIATEGSLIDEPSRKRRRGAVIPGTRAAKLPGDADEVPFAITINRKSGTVELEVVAYAHGGIKGAYSIGVRRRENLQLSGPEAQRCRETLGKIPVNVEGSSELDGAHGAPVFLGGALFGFALQECVGQPVTAIVTASSLLKMLSPTENSLAEPLHHEEKALWSTRASAPWESSPAAGSLSRTPRGNSADTLASRGEVVRREDQRSGTLRCSSKGSILRIENVVASSEDGSNTGKQQDSDSSKPLVEKMIHLFRHGTLEALDAEVARVGGDKLRALRTADGRSLVHLAATSERLTPLEFVHDRLGMNVVLSEVNGSGSTALHTAAYSGRIESLEYLLAKGGDLLKQNKAGLTPAMLAALTGRRAVLKWLLEHTDSAGGGGIFFARNKAGHDVLDMIVDMDEAAVYGCPTHTLLENAAFPDENPEDESADDQNGVESRPSTAKTLGSDEVVDSNEAMVTADVAWEMYAGGKIDARGFIGILAATQGKGLRASWPRIIAGLPSSHPHLTAVLEREVRTLERERVEQKAKASAEARVARNTAHDSSRQLADLPGTEEEEGVCIRSATAKFLRGKIDSEGFYMQLKACMGRKRAGAAIMRVANDMPSDKACALIHYNRARRHDERLSKNEKSRKSRRARKAFSKREGNERTWRSAAADDDSSVTSIVSVGSSVSSLSATLVAKGQDLEDAMVMFQKGRLTANALHDSLEAVFGQQTVSVMPAVLTSIKSNKKRTELAEVDRCSDTGKRPEAGSRQNQQAQSSPKNGSRDPGDRRRRKRHDGNRSYNGVCGSDRGGGNGNKAAALDEFVAIAEGEAGAAAKAGRKPRQDDEEEEEEEKKEEEGRKGQDQEDRPHISENPDEAGTHREFSKAKKYEVATIVPGGPDDCLTGAIDGVESAYAEAGKTDADKKDTDGGVENDIENEIDTKSRKAKNGGVRKGVARTSEEEEAEESDLYMITEGDRTRYDDSFGILCREVGPDDAVKAMEHGRAADVLSKSGLPYESLGKIWALADADRDGKLSRAEWAVAMHLIVCVGVKKLPVPSKLPTGLSRMVADGGFSSMDEAESTTAAGKQRVTDQGLRPNVEKSVERDRGGDRRKAEGAGNAVKQEIRKRKKVQKDGKTKGLGAPKKEQQKKKGNGDVGGPMDEDRSSPPPLDLSTATRSFRDGVLSAEGFLPILQDAFGDRLTAAWPDLLATLPENLAEQLAHSAGVEFARKNTEIRRTFLQSTASRPPQA